MIASTKRIRAAGIPCALGVAAGAFAGPLDPPPGPPAPTQKTLQQMEPRIPIESLPVVINNPGSYYFTGDLIGVNGANGIVINASNVSIDLCGFTMTGVPGSGDGVVVNQTRDNITVVNGTIREWGFDGLDLFNTRECRVENIHAFANSGEGIVLG
ncbi:MAG: hypothetical protein VYC34_02745, partial [Planctomycetota bacterium]|nr:hypothetical protein [Planctomycetota bacterium]